MCLSEEGQVYVWGGSLHKKRGETGEEKKGARELYMPTVVQSLTHKNIKHIDCGDFHSLALDDQGQLYSWGGGGTDYNKG